MSFQVEPQALRTYAMQLSDDHRAADLAKRYVHQYGDFSMHEQGLMGMIAPGHRNLVHALDALLSHLGELTDACGTAMNQVAANYERTDTRAAGALDATFPQVPRPVPSD